MRTIIINTLGSELRQNQLFYLPFPAEQFHWIEKDLQNIAECAQEIAVYQGEQTHRQQYHLILLISLAQFENAEFSRIRHIYKEILSAYLNTHLLHPLCQQLQLPPAGVSVVFMLKEKVDGEGFIEFDRELDWVLGFSDGLQQDPPVLSLKDRNGQRLLDLSAYFSNALSSYVSSRDHQKAYFGGLEEQRKDNADEGDPALEVLRQNISKHLSGHKACAYIPAGTDRSVELPCQTSEFAPLTTEWALCCVDIQLNLCEHLQQNLNSDTVWKLELTPHTADALYQRIYLAQNRVNHLKNKAPKLRFFQKDMLDFDASSIPDIWEALKNAQIPEVLEAKQANDTPTSSTQEGKTALGRKLRQTWFLIGAEKKKFEQCYSELQAHFAPGAAEARQKQILDTCADIFGKWRRETLSSKDDFPAEPTADEMPIFSQTACEEKLAKAQQEWGEIAVSQLADYTDVRKEAERVKADFRKAYRLWPGGHPNATSKFFTYSLVLAISFLLIMLVPYMGITGGQGVIDISRAAHFSASLSLFVVLYVIGVLVWMRALCAELHVYTLQMQDLVADSHRRRKESIVQAVEAYRSVLPRCLYYYEQLQLQRRIHGENLQRKERYNAHKNILSKAEELLHELNSLLRMPEIKIDGSGDCKGGIDFELPPSDPKNVPYYVFMSEKWGEG